MNFLHFLWLKLKYVNKRKSRALVTGSGELSSCICAQDVGLTALNNLHMKCFENFAVQASHWRLQVKYGASFSRSAVRPEILHF